MTHAEFIANAKRKAERAVDDLASKRDLHVLHAAAARELASVRALPGMSPLLDTIDVAIATIAAAMATAPIGGEGWADDLPTRLAISSLARAVSDAGSGLLSVLSDVLTIVEAEIVLRERPSSAAARDAADYTEQAIGELADAVRACALRTN